MNEKLKNFFCILGGAIAGFFATIFGCALRYRRTTDRTEESIERAKEINSDTKRTIDGIKQSTSKSRETVEQLGKSNERLERSIDTSRDIFEEIEKQKLT